MSAAVAEKITPSPAPAAPGEIVAFESRARGEARAGAGLPSVKALIEEARVGADRLSRMSHDELRGVIAERVRMLETELDEREARRAAIEEALVAQRVLDARRQRARRIRRRVNIGSSLLAAMFTGLIVAGMF